MFTYLLPFIGAATAVFALPTAALSVRQSTSLCANFGLGGFNTAYNFTLAAWNTTLPNANTTGAPIVLSPSGVVEDAKFEVLSTYASYPYNSFPSFSLIGGALIPYAADGSNSTSDLNVTSGGLPTFITTNVELPAPAQIYCGIADADPTQGTPFPVLAVNGDASGFALCLDREGSQAQNNIVWQPTADNGDAYVYETCYAVNVQLVSPNL